MLRKKDWQFYRRAVVKAMQAMNERRPTKRVKLTNYPDDDSNELCIEIDGGDVIISAGQVEYLTVTIMETEKRSEMTNGFIIEKAWYTPGSYEEPPDGGIEIAKKCVNFGEVLNWIMEDIFENRAQDFAMYYDYLETNHLYPKK